MKKKLCMVWKKTSLWPLMSVCWSRLVCRLVIIFYKKKWEFTLSCHRPIEVLVFDMYVLWFFREYGAVQRNKSSFFGAVWAYPRILFKPAGRLRHIAITWRHVLDWRHVFIKLKSCLGVQRRGAKVNRPPWYILDLTKNVYICQYSLPPQSLDAPDVMSFIDIQHVFPVYLVFGYTGQSIFLFPNSFIPSQWKRTWKIMYLDFLWKILCFTYTLA